MNMFERAREYRQMLDKKTNELKQETYQQFKTVIDDAFQKIPTEYHIRVADMIKEIVVEVLNEKKKEAYNAERKELQEYREVLQEHFCEHIRDIIENNH